MSRPTPPKTAEILKYEGKSHRTKAEIRQREKSEKALITGVNLKEKKEVENNKVAHKEFLRMKKLLEKIGKADDMYGNIINRYCQLVAECTEFEERREQVSIQQDELLQRKDEMDYATYLNLSDKLSKTLLAYDKQIQTKRKMMVDIEKENVMTIASSLRSVPKTPEKKTNPLKEALSG